MGHKSSPIYYKIISADWYKKFTIENYEDYIGLDKKDNDYLIKNIEISKDILEKWGEGGYFYKEGLIFYQNEDWVYGTDIKSFEVLGYGYAKDKNFAYYQDKQIWGSDPKTFEYLDGRYSRDKNTAYLNDEKLKGSDPSTFEYLDGGYAKDNNYIYYGNRVDLKITEGINTSNFKVLVNSIATDGINIYEDGKKVTFIDTDTFELINNYYAKDKNNYYDLLYNIDILEKIDKRTFRVLFGPYATDKNGIYNSGSLIKDVKLNPYFLKKASDDEGISNAFIKYKNNIYHTRYSEICKIENVDINTLRQLSSNWLVDKNNAYHVDHFDCEVDVIQNVDTSSFEELEWGYAKDKNNVYFEVSTVEDADSKTFEAIDYGYAKDKNRIYLDGVELKVKEEEEEEYYDYWGNDEDKEEKEEISFTGFDTDSFEFLNRYTFKDKNFVYGYNYNKYYGRHDDELEIINTDPNKFSLSKNIIKKNDNLYIKNSDSFRYISEYLATNGNTIYTQNGVLINSNNIDPNKIKIIDNLFFTNDKSIYYLSFSKNMSHVNKIENVDIKTFKILGNYYSKDKNNYYYKNYVIKNEIDIDTFEVINSIFAKDKNNIYYEGLIIYLLDMGIDEISKVENITPGHIMRESFIYNRYMQEKMGRTGSMHLEYHIN